MGSLKVINFYNPCRQLEVEQLDEIWENVNGKVIWCGDFNTHSTLWGNRDDYNGRVIERFLEEKGLVCLNDSSSTRVDVVRGKKSAIDLTIVTRTMADKCSWEVHRENNIGSHHIIIRAGMELQSYVNNNQSVEK